MLYVGGVFLKLYTVLASAFQGSILKAPNFRLGPPVGLEKMMQTLNPGWSVCVTLGESVKVCDPSHKDWLWRNL